MFSPCSRCSLAFGKSIYLHLIGTLGASISSLIPAVSVPAVLAQRAVREA